MTRALPVSLTLMAATSWAVATVLTKVALHELAPARGMLDRTLTLADGRIATAQPDRVREDAELVPL